MENLLSYFFKINIIFSVLFLVYYIFLRKEKFLVINRFVLIGIVFFAFLLPLSPNLNLIPGLIAEPHLQPETKNLVSMVQSSQLIDAPAVQEVFSWVGFAIKGYFLLIIILSLKFLVHLFRLYLIIRKSNSHKVNGLVYCEPEHALPPFSFFHFIVVSKHNLESDSYQQIILHEQSHCKQLHSLDALFSELLCVLLWVNPLVYLYKREVKLNLEYLADEATLSAGIEFKSYQLNLVFNALKLSENLPANYFYSSKLKARIAMMNKNNPRLANAYKYLCILPLIVLMNLLMGFQEVQPLFSEQGNWIKPLSKINELSQSNAARVKGKKKPHSLAKSAEELADIHIDATTDTVKVKLVPNSIKSRKKYKGIYVFEDKVMTEKELRNSLKATGELAFILASRPTIGVYSEQDSNAVKIWGKSAKNGVVYVKTYKTK